MISTAATTPCAEAEVEAHAAPRLPILLAGDDLAWLSRQPELAGRRLIVLDGEADALAALAEESLDGVVASYQDVARSIALLRDAATTQPAALALLRADARELSGVSNPFPAVPRLEDVATFDDQLRTKLAATRWQANRSFLELTQKITKVPTLPSIYTQITDALQKPDVSIDEIAELVCREPAVSAKLLQMVNSPFFALRGRVTSVRDATNLLGLSRLRGLVLATTLFRQFDGAQCKSFSMARFESHSLKIASWAAAIAKEQSRDKRTADLAFTASLLHNFGVLLLAANVPEQYDQVLKQAQEQRVSIAWAELQVFGATHAEVAGAILASWGIPFPIVNAVGLYPVPSHSDDTEFSPLTAVHAATAVDAFARTGMLAYDREYMDRLQLTEKLEGWCQSLGTE